MADKIKLFGRDGICPMCDKSNEFEVDISKFDLNGYQKWKNREMLIQNALPKLSPEEREVLISGLCFDCQKIIFGK